MRVKIKSHLDKVLSHLYINPLERCNLRCKICYTRKTSPILREEEILEFIRRYEKVHPLQTVTFCGGEVFALPYFPGLMNKLTASVYGSGETFFGDVRQLFSRFQSLSPSSLSESLLPKQNMHSNGKLQQTFKAPQKAHPPPEISTFRPRHPLFVQIITNGTIDRLAEFANPNMVNLIVSLDGLPQYHDKNRGEGNFKKSINFLQKAKRMGFHTEIFSIVTRQNINQIDKFEKYLFNSLYSEGPVASPPSRLAGSDGQVERAPDSRHPTIGSVLLPVTYHPRKPPAYLLHHPASNIFGETAGFDFLTDKQMLKIIKERKAFPPKDLGCYQIALVSDGSVFGCCEGTVPIGKMDDDIKLLSARLKERIQIWEKTNNIRNCLGCSQPDFACGIKKYLSQI